MHEGAHATALTRKGNWKIAAATQARAPLTLDPGLDGHAARVRFAPLGKLREITGAGSVLYVVLGEYGHSIKLIDCTTTLRLSARLVDTRSGAVLYGEKTS